MNTVSRGHRDWEFVPPRQRPDYPNRITIIKVLREDQKFDEEQRDRVAAWLTANGVDPKTVSPGEIQIETRENGYRIDLIHFWEYLRDADGNVMADPTDRNSPLRFRRTVLMSTDLPHQPDFELTPEEIAERRAWIQAGQELSDEDGQSA